MIKLRHYIVHKFGADALGNSMAGMVDHPIYFPRAVGLEIYT
jgi:hypothetical protein